MPARFVLVFSICLNRPRTPVKYHQRGDNSSQIHHWHFLLILYSASLPFRRYTKVRALTCLKPELSYTVRKID